MSIEILRLPETDFNQLETICEGYVPDPSKSIAVVAKQNGQIVGRMMLIAVAHVEAAWVHEDLRNGTILERMVKEIEKQAKQVGISTVFAYSETTEMDGYIARLGYEKSPLRVFRKEL
jgi:N-acetylglutamate synthase-like GNAT family acetyltransferase